MSGVSLPTIFEFYLYHYFRKIIFWYFSIVHVQEICHKEYIFETAVQTKYKNDRGTFGTLKN